MKLPLPRLAVFLLLISFTFPAAWAAPAADIVEGWGIQRFNGSGDLDEAIELSKEKARLDLSANILTSVKVKTVDKVVQKDGEVQEEYKRITVTKVEQVLREVRLDRPQVDQARKSVTTRAWVPQAVARQIIAECLEKMREKEDQRRKDLAKVREFTDGDRYYFKKKILELEDQEDLNRLTAEMNRLRAELVKEQLSDIQDVKNAVKTIFLKDFPRDDETTFLAYIEMSEYVHLVHNYREEVYRAERLRPSNPYTIGTVENPDNHPKIAETYLPVKDYEMLGWGSRWTYFSGVDPEFDLQIYGLYSHAAGHFGIQPCLGLGIGLGPNDIVKAHYLYTDWGYEKVYNFHWTAELDGYFYFTEVKSDRHLGFLKFGVLGAFSHLEIQNEEYGDMVEIAHGWSGGFVLGGGMTIFHKSGIFLKTMDVGLDVQWLPSGYYNEGTQVAIGFFGSFGI